MLLLRGVGELRNNVKEPYFKKAQLVNLILKKTTTQDLETLFLFQTDETACQMAAFTAEDPLNKAAYMEKWTKFIGNPAINMHSIFDETTLVGSVLHFDMHGEMNVSYWIGRKYWGKGIATKALQLFLQKVQLRPLFGSIAFDNKGSQRVLEKCGFVQIETEMGFANARKKKIEELIFKLDY